MYFIILTGNELNPIESQKEMYFSIKKCISQTPYSLMVNPLKSTQIYQITATLRELAEPIRRT